MKYVEVITLALIAFVLMGCGKAQTMLTVTPVPPSATPITVSPTDTILPSPLPPTITPTQPPPTPTLSPTSVPLTVTPTQPAVILTLNQDRWQMTQFQTSDQIANIGPNRETLTAGSGQVFVSLSFESQTGKSLFEVFMASGAKLAQVYLADLNGKKYAAIHMSDVLLVTPKTTSVVFEAVPSDQIGNLELHFLSAEPVRLAGKSQGQEDLPTAEPTNPAPSGEPFYLYPFCNCKETVPAGNAPTLRWAWVTTTQEYTQDFVSASKTVVTIDGKAYTNLEKYWGEIAFSTDDNGYKSVWTYPLPVLSPGTHHIELKLSLSKAVTDGYDSNNDGKPDQYGPGDTFNGWVDTVIATAAATCVNGAPAGHWLLIVDKSSAGDGTITIDGVEQSVKSGRNEFFLTVDQSHAVLIGTNTMNYSAPECGENTVVLP